MSLMKVTAEYCGRTWAPYAPVDEYSLESRQRRITHGVHHMINYTLILWGLIIGTLLVSRIGNLRVGFLIFIFMSTFASIRVKFGGYHTKNEYVCLFVTVTAPIILAISAIKVDVELWMIAIVYVFATYTILTKRVVDNPNKRYRAGGKILTLELKEKFYIQGISIFLIIAIIHSLKILLSNLDVNLAREIAGSASNYFGVYLKNIIGKSLLFIIEKIWDKDVNDIITFAVAAGFINLHFKQE